MSFKSIAIKPPFKRKPPARRNTDRARFSVANSEGFPARGQSGLILSALHAYNCIKPERCQLLSGLALWHGHSHWPGKKGSQWPGHSLCLDSKHAKESWTWRAVRAGSWLSPKRREPRPNLKSRNPPDLRPALFQKLILWPFVPCRIGRELSLPIGQPASRVSSARCKDRVEPGRFPPSATGVHRPMAARNET
jgi:hypothetical protein